RFVPVALGAVFVGGLITMRRFRSSAPKARNGFVARENCFVQAQATKQFIKKKYNYFNNLFDGLLALLGSFIGRTRPAHGRSGGSTSTARDGLLASLWR